MESREGKDTITVDKDCPDSTKNALGEMINTASSGLLQMRDIEPPIGDFILAQKDIKPLMLPNGGYFHYSDVCTLLKRLKKQLTNDGQ
jgi:hypothetical protein